MVGILAPVLMIAGAGDAVHEISWFLYYGGPVPWTSTTYAAPAWLGYIVVALLAATRWRRLAAAASWVALAGLIVALHAQLTLAFMAGWLLLGLAAAVGLSAGRPPADGRRPVSTRALLPVWAAAGLLIFFRLLGHHYAALQVLGWAAAAAAVVSACRPFRQARGRWALVVLSAPVVAGFASWLIRLFPVAGGPSEITTVLSYAVPVLIPVGVIVATRLRATRTHAGRPEH